MSEASTKLRAAERGSSRSTRGEVLEAHIEKVQGDGYQDVVLFVDYLQKVSYRRAHRRTQP